MAFQVKVTNEEDYYVSQDELWDWDEDSNSTTTHTTDHTDFTFCLGDSTGEDGKEKYSIYDHVTGGGGSSSEDLDIRREKKRKAKTIFCLELGQYEATTTTETGAKENLTKSSRSPSSFGGFGDFALVEGEGKKDYLKSKKEKAGNLHQCKVHLPYKSPSKLILLQKEQHDTLFTSPVKTRGSPPEGPYFNTILLDNPTSSLVAFKVYCNSSAWTHFTVKPAFGVISANSRVSVKIKTKMSRRKSGRQLDSLDVHWDQFTIKFFPVYFNKKEESSQYLKMLNKQSPHLIQSIRLPRIILWDASDLHSMLDSLSTCSSCMTTRDALEKQLYHRYITHSIPVARRNAGLNEKYFQILAASQAMRHSLRLLYFATKAHELFIFVVFCTLIFIFVLPHL